MSERSREEYRSYFLAYHDKVSYYSPGAETLPELHNFKSELQRLKSTLLSFFRGYISAVKILLKS